MKITNKIYFANINILVEKYKLSPKIPKPVHLHRSAVRAVTIGSPHMSLRHLGSKPTVI